MPRAQTLTADKVVNYFKTESLEIGELVLGLCSAEVRAKQKKSREAKARAHQPTIGGPAAAVGASPKKAKATKRKARKKAKATAKANGAAAAQTTDAMVEGLQSEQRGDQRPPAQPTHQ